jgi:enoyl-CoA hydratase
VSRLVEPGQALDAAFALAGQIAAAGPLAVRAARRVVRLAGQQDDAELRALSQELLDDVLRSEDTKEGLRAFAEKRPPQWRGR